MVQTKKVGTASAQTINETTLLGCIAVKDDNIKAFVEAIKKAEVLLAAARKARRDLQARLAGVVIGDVVTFKVSGHVRRGRVERFTGARYVSDRDRLGDPLALDVVLIRKADGTDGARSIVERWTVER